MARTVTESATEFLHGALNFVDEFLRWLCRLIYRNLYFVFSLPIVFVVLRVPQIYSVVSETVEVPQMLNIWLLSSSAVLGQTGRHWLGYHSQQTPLS